MMANLSTRRFRVFAMVAALAVASACSTDAGEPTEPSDTSLVLKWDDVEASGTTGTSLAIQVSTDGQADVPGGSIALIRDDGKARFLSIGQHPNGRLAADGGVLCATTELATYHLEPGGATRWDRKPASSSAGAWAGVRADGSCAMVLNVGSGPSGYEAHVFWEQSGERRHAIVPDVPTAAGQSADAIWVTNNASSSAASQRSGKPGTVTLYKTDLKTAKVSVAMQWKLPVRTRPGKSAITYDAGGSTDLFSHNGLLYQVEELIPSVDGSYPPLTDEMPGMLRLTETDPVSKRQRSTILRSSPDMLVQRGDGAVSRPAVATMHGYFRDGKIYVTDSRGSILAVDVATKAMTEVGKLNVAALRAEDAVAAFHGDRLELVYFTSGEAVSMNWDSYDLKSGDLLSAKKVDGFDGVLDSFSWPTSAAALN